MGRYRGIEKHALKGDLIDIQIAGLVGVVLAEVLALLHIDAIHRDIASIWMLVSAPERNAPVTGTDVQQLCRIRRRLEEKKARMMLPIRVNRKWTMYDTSKYSGGNIR